MNKLTNSVENKLSVLNELIVIEIMYIPKTKLSKTLNYH